MKSAATHNILNHALRWAWCKPPLSTLAIEAAHSTGKEKPYCEMIGPWGLARLLVGSTDEGWVVALCWRSTPPKGLEDGWPREASVIVSAAKGFEQRSNVLYHVAPGGACAAARAASTEEVAGLVEIVRRAQCIDSFRPGKLRVSLTSLAKGLEALARALVSKWGPPSMLVELYPWAGPLRVRRDMLPWVEGLGESTFRRVLGILEAAGALRSKRLGMTKQVFVCLASEPILRGLSSVSPPHLEALLYHILPGPGRECWNVQFSCSRELEKRKNIF